MNVGKSYEERVNHNLEFPLKDLVEYYKKNEVPFLIDEVIDVCFTAGTPFRRGSLGEKPSIEEFLGTLRDELTKIVFLAYYLAEDEIMEHIAQQTQTEETGGVEQIAQQG